MQLKGPRFLLQGTRFPLQGHGFPYGPSVPHTQKTQEGYGGLGGENPGAFLKVGPIFQQPFSLLESAQTLAGVAFRAARK